MSRDGANALVELFRASEADLFGPLDLLLAMTLSAFLCIVLTYVYRYTHRGTSYSQSFLVTMIIMAVATSVVMMIIGSNIARAFSLVGALSIIRFRTAVKDSRDTAFLFAAMIAGMGCGTGFYLASIALTAFISALLLLLFYVDFGIKERLECILRVTYRETDGAQERIEAAIGRCCPEFSMINRILNLEEDQRTNVYLVRPGSSSEQEVERHLREVGDVVNFSLYQSDQHAPL